MTLRITQIILLIANFLFGTSMAAGMVYVFPVIDSISKLLFSLSHKILPLKESFIMDETLDESLLKIPIYNTQPITQLN